MSAASAYKERFDALPSRLMPDMQAQAMKAFLRMGFPDRHLEDWRFTPVQPLAREAFSPATGTVLTRDEVLSRFPFVEDAAWLVIENGQWNREASSLPVQEGIAVCPIGEAGMGALVGEQANVELDAFTALNTAFIDDGTVTVRFSAKAQTGNPLYLLQVMTTAGVICHNRLLVVVDDHATAALSVITAAGTDADGSFNNAVAEFVVGESATVDYNLVQAESESSYQVCNTFVRQARASTFRIHTVTTGGRIVRNQLTIRSQGEGTHTRLYGLYLPGGDQLMDNHTAMHHDKPHGTSDQLYKGLVGGRAQAVFNGKIIVARDAQKTAAYQSNKNILLGNDAVVNAKPQLEIFADDVKCTHGATTGQLDDDALFYLRSRGIGKDEAVSMLNMAFAVDVLESVSDERLRSFTRTIVEDKLNRKGQP
jgi:Fe-S cluster assembly protein SufD